MITGNQYGTDNISTEGAFLTTPYNTLSSFSNMFFAGFNTNGEREFCSYYGGISTTTSEINPYLDNDGSLYLWGTTNSSTDIATSNGYYSTMTNPSLNQPFGYVAKFNLKTMNTSEADLSKDLVLYNNPNSRNFHLAGSVLQKLQCYLKIYDASGRVVFQQKLTKDSRQIFNLEHQLTKGNYFLEVSAESNGKIKTFKMIVK